VTPTTSRLVTALGVLAALALVAVAARGTTPAGGGGSRTPSDTVLDIVFSLYVVGIVAGLVLFVVMLVLRRVVAPDAEALRRSPLRSLVVVALAVGGLVLALRWLDVREPALRLQELPQAATAVEPTELDARDRRQYEAKFAWKPMLVLGLLVLVGLLAWWRAGRARLRARVREPRQTLAEELADVLEETLDTLRAEPDPRRAVIGAYARLERVAAASGLARRPAEAPVEFLGRMLTGLEVGAPSVRRLTALFERAKFSHHAVDEAMKQDAIRALESVQEDLRAAEARRAEARAEAARLERERLRELAGR